MWLPDELCVEEYISLDTLEKLRQMGHKVTVIRTMGAVKSILVDPKTGLSYGASDPRRVGLAVGY